MSRSDINVLYVEDNYEVRQSTSEVLALFFDKVETAEDGLEGLQKYTTYHKDHGEFYDIVISDILMPHMNGIEMSEKILKLNPEQEIIIISAHNEEEKLFRLIQLGISNFMLKPIELKQLKKVINKVVDSIRNKRALRKKHEELKSLNVLLNNALQKAEHASQMKSQFLANMSHEIRTPLNAITGFISLLNDQENDPKKLKYFDMIRNSSDALLQIINDILDISKIESGKFKIEMSSFNPYKDLIAIAELFQAKAAEKGVTLTIKYNTTMPSYLFSDALRIKQIISNLLSNAVKFTPEGKQVKCIVWYDRGVLNIRVKDYGIGIAEDKQSKIFESFSQAESSTSREYGGTGLGLAISSKLAEMLGGKLTLESEEGKGSVFQLSVPMPLGQDDTSTEVEEETNKTVDIDAHVLIVEDIETNRMFIAIVLEEAGITYDMAKDGIEAIEMFSNGKYDLILMDENMPRLTGTEACKEILKIEKEKDVQHTPIITLTANALQGDKERFLNAGMDAYLSKPVDPKELIRVITQVLQHKEST